jgi:hypothetical protein
MTSKELTRLIDKLEYDLYTMEQNAKFLNTELVKIRRTLFELMGIKC